MGKKGEKEEGKKKKKKVERGPRAAPIHVTHPRESDLKGGGALGARTPRFGIPAAAAPFQ